MTQVPQTPHYLIIGRGRVARHFAHYFSLLNIPFSQWHRGMDFSGLPGQVAASTHILLLIKDDAIAGFAETHLRDAPAYKIHFSGSLVVPHIHGAHPLMTFGQDLYGLDTYQNIPFVIEKTAPSNGTLLPRLPNRMERIEPGQKPLYHALCVMAGNFSCLLWQKFFDGFANDLGLPPEIGQSYMMQQTQNILKDYRTALTGPLVRGDRATIDRNLSALAGDPYRDVYESFVNAYQESKKK